LIRCLVRCCVCVDCLNSLDRIAHRGSTSTRISAEEEFALTLVTRKEAGAVPN
jgi:hypothetical protein